MRKKTIQFFAEHESPIETLRRRFGSVEVLSPSETNEGFGWFVQIRRSSQDQFPMGAFGKTAQQAATRLVAVTHLWGTNDGGG